MALAFTAIEAQSDDMIALSYTDDGAAGATVDRVLSTGATAGAWFAARAARAGLSTDALALASFLRDYEVTVLPRTLGSAGLWIVTALRDVGSNTIALRVTAAGTRGANIVVVQVRAKGAIGTN